MAIVVVSGALANKCWNGGEAWVRLNWILGLKKLGCQVFFIEEIQGKHCVDAAGGSPRPAHDVLCSVTGGRDDRVGLPDRSKESGPVRHTPLHRVQTRIHHEGDVVDGHDKPLTTGLRRNRRRHR